MFGRLIILLAVVVGVLYFLHWFRKTPPEQVSRVLKKGILYGLVAALVILAVTGRLPWLFTAIGAAIPNIDGVGVALSRELWLLMHPELRALARIRAVADWIPSALAPVGRGD